MPLNDIDAKLGRDLLRYIGEIDKLDAPNKVLNRLHDITAACDLNVLGALLFPVRWGNWDTLEVGKTVFIHKSAPKGWWDEHFELLQKHPGPGMMLAQLALAPFTMSETMQRVEPLGIDRWPFELAYKYGMRDRLSCPVGGRWLVVYWSRKVLGPGFTPERRALLFLGGTFAAIRLQALTGLHTKRLGKGATLTARELAVLRLLSVGKPVREIAKLLELGEETVRSHVKKAQAKLGVQTQTHAVAQAMRLQMIG
jgi:DNA-binding CsgD family transcriptional regulator